MRMHANMQFFGGIDAMPRRLQKPWLAILVGLTIPFSGSGQEPEKLRLSHSHQAVADSEIHATAVAFADYLSDHDAAIDVQIYANNALGQEREVYEAMQFGAGADCAISGTAILSSFYRRIGVVDLPSLWRDYQHIHEVLDGPVGSQLADELMPVNFKVIAWLDSWGARNIMTTDQIIETADDLRGLKIRTIPSPVYVRTINSLGASATPMAFGEVYMSLETGVLDGFEHTPTVILSGRFYEVASNLTLTRHLYGPLVFVCSKSFWESIPDGTRQMVQAAAQHARNHQRRLAPMKEKQALAKLAELGVSIHDIDIDQFESGAAQLRRQLADRAGANDLLVQIENRDTADKDDR